MVLVPKREYVVLILGDIIVFTVSLWAALALRYLEAPSADVMWKHVVPFSLLFAGWAVVFFLADLYGKHTRLFRSRLPITIFYTQLINVAIAAVFFFALPVFGLAPKTILLLYLLISSALIYFWRVGIFPRMPMLLSGRKLKGVLVASGPDAELLAKEVAADRRYGFSFEYVIDTANSPPHEIIRKAVRLAEESELTFIVVDLSDKAFEAARPIIYDAAFNKRNFTIVGATELFQEVFDRVPLSLIRYDWVLESVSASRTYDLAKRATDIVSGSILGALSLLVYPFVILAIKLDDGGPVFIMQQRVGKYEKPIHVLKFRSMSGNDEGKYGESGKSSLVVTRAGKWLRLLRIDELPQLWNIVRGELSLVGPRPELPTLSREYSARIPYYNARYLVSPGLTGWAQIKHDRHPHHGTDVANTKEKLSYDLYYLKHRSLLIDLFIVLQTIRIILTARGS